MLGLNNNNKHMTKKQEEENGKNIKNTIQTKETKQQWKD